jgi:hypothetical protein
VSFIVLDTDVASTILRGRLTDPLRSRLVGHSPCITFVTLGELTKWTVLRDWGPRRLAGLANWRQQVVLLPFDEAIATKWARSKPTPSSAVVLDPSTIVGSPRAAWSMAYLWQRSTPKISPTKPSTTSFASSDLIRDPSQREQRPEHPLRLVFIKHGHRRLRDGASSGRFSKPHTRGRLSVRETASDLGEVFTFGFDLRERGYVPGLPTG